MNIEQIDSSIFLSLLPIGILVFLQIFFARISLKNGKVRNFMDGEPSVIVNRGIVNFKE